MSWHGKGKLVNPKKNYESLRKVVRRCGEEKDAEGKSTDDHREETPLLANIIKLTGEKPGPRLRP